MKVELLTQMLQQSNYDPVKIEFLQQGFANGFDIGYQGPKIRQSNAKNIPLKVGNETELWNKIIKEVKLGRVAGPFDNPPFENYIQSPIGLVPKSGNLGKTRLIFHLSFEFNKDKEEGKSLNQCTPKEMCKVKYRDLDHAVVSCLSTHKEAQKENRSNLHFDEMETVPTSKDDQYPIFMGKTDVQSAFRLVPLSIWSWSWLLMLARHPVTKKWKYFVDKCLPFGASISCAIFQRFSNALCHIAKFRAGQDTITNYLDDFLFVAYTRLMCNDMINQFLNICSTIGVPIAEEKTEWGTNILVFLGILLNGFNLTLGVPEEKRQKALFLLRKMMDKHKSTVRDLQLLCGFLNFLNRAIYPGRAFLRRMYSKLAIVGVQTQYKNNGKLLPLENKPKSKLTPYHHVTLDSNFRADCKTWIKFLDHGNLQRVVARPMLDITMFKTSTQISFFTDASAGFEKGFGCVYGKRWTYGKWEKDFIQNFEPSIEFLELYALVVGILTWEKELSNCRIIIHCDNQAVVGMVNKLTSSCKRCLHLIRILVLNGLIFNRRVSVVYIKSSDNKLSDALSRGDLTRFRREGPHMNQFPDPINPQVESAQQLFLSVN